MFFSPILTPITHLLPARFRIDRKNPFAKDFAAKNVPGAAYMGKQNKEILGSRNVQADKLS